MCLAITIAAMTFRSWLTARRVFAVLIASFLLLPACAGAEPTEMPEPAETTASAAKSPTTAAPTEDPEEKVTEIRVKVQGGEVITASSTVEVGLGQEVILRVTSDVADEVHVHGYDHKAEVSAGGSAVIEFTADIPGAFEVEMEEAGLTLVELNVS